MKFRGHIIADKISTSGIEGDLQVSGSLIVSDKIVAESFYFTTGGEVGTGGASGIDVFDDVHTYSDATALTFNPISFYLNPTSTGQPVVNLQGPMVVMLRRDTNLALVSADPAASLPWESVALNTPNVAWWSSGTPTIVTVPSGVTWIKLALGVTYVPTGAPTTASHATTNILVNGVTPYPPGGLINVRAPFVISSGVSVCTPFAYGPIPVKAGDQITVTVASTWATASAMNVQGGRTYLLIEALMT